ncbi:Hypothetical protein A7982_04152 [Minicystis rosea]|nr:Hypothetical protein A7982_04152 [Minicystis rosea]
MAWRYLLSLACIVSGPALAGCGGALVSGTIERQKNDHTFNDDVVFTGDAHVVIELARYQGEDAPTAPVTEIDIPFTGFPFAFDVPGDPGEAFANEAKLLLHAKVFNHAGTKLQVGDFINELSVEIEEAGTSVVVQAAGLEACDAPNAGGACTSEQ